MILKILRRTVLAVVFFLVYLASTIPVGLFLYSMKSDILGINIFTKTGFHAYMQCLQEQAYKIEVVKNKPITPEEAYKLEIEKNAEQTANFGSKVND